MTGLPFYVQADGSVRAAHFPELIHVSVEALRHLSPDLVRRQGDRLYITVANGTAEYVIIQEDLLTKTYECARLYARLIPD